MPLVITIKSGTAQVRQVNTKNGPKKVAEQVGFISHDDEVRKVRIPVAVEDGQAPYPPGDYLLSAGSFEVGNYGDLQVNRFRISLEAVRAAAAVAAVK